MRWFVAVVVAAGVLASGAGARDTPHLHKALVQVKKAILQEQDALARLDKKPVNWEAVDQDTFGSGIRVGAANYELQQAVKDDEVDAADVSKIRDELKQADVDDHAGHVASTKEDAAGVRKGLRAALPLKHKAQSQIEELISETNVKVCEVTKPFQVFAIPEGYAGSYAEVYPHNIPHNAKHVHVSFIDVATGKAPGPEVFPGQTWKATVKGYQPDGKFVVHIDVSGTGFGKPDANAKNWKVVVTFDCP